MAGVQFTQALLVLQPRVPVFFHHPLVEPQPRGTARIMFAHFVVEELRIASLQ